MSPLELKILLNIYASPVWFDKDYENHKGFISDLEDELIISICPPEKAGYHGLEMRPRGMAYVSRILNLPLPEEAWVDEYGSLIKFS